MDAGMVREYCLSKKGTNESMPFDDETLVFKVIDRMFCLLNLVAPISINLKCDPELLLELVDRYNFVRPGYHMNKKHWITVDLSESARDSRVFEWIDNSYLLVLNGLSQKKRELLMKL